MCAASACFMLPSSRSRSSLMEHHATRYARIDDDAATITPDSCCMYDARCDSVLLIAVMRSATSMRILLASPLADEPDDDDDDDDNGEADDNDTSDDDNGVDVGSVRVTVGSCGAHGYLQ